MAKDYLWCHLRDLPYFRSLVRAIEARAYDELDLPAPTLDLGCGDGHFASVALNTMVNTGVDPCWKPLKEAASRGVYSGVVQAAGARLPFPSGWFGSCFSNSVLEHIPEVEAVLAETGRVLQPGAPFVFCVPSQRFLKNLSVSAALERVGAHRCAEAYRRFFNRISRHHHCDPPEVWEARLERAGFRLERWWHYVSPAAMRVVEWGHYLGLPALVCRLLTGRWIVAPFRWNLALTEAFVRRYYQEPIPQPQGSYTFYIARKAAG